MAQLKLIVTAGIWIRSVAANHSLPKTAPTVMILNPASRYLPKPWDLWHCFINSPMEHCGRCHNKPGTGSSSRHFRELLQHI